MKKLKIISKIIKNFKYLKEQKIKKNDFMEYCKSEIDKQNIISFDIFDTLLVRKINVPNDLFFLMQTKVNNINTNIKDFKNIRQNMRNYVKSENKNGEEINLIDRYNTLKYTIPNITDTDIKKIYNLELEIELELITKRNFCYELYLYCIEKNKQIVFTSDIFFEKNFIIKILSKNNYDKYNLLLLSSEEGKLKHTGSLFKVLIKKMNTNNILHIGDNKHSDIKMAKKFNIKTLYIPSVFADTYKKTNILKEIKYKDTILENYIKGLCNIQLSDYPLNYSSNTIFNGDLSDFTYVSIGPIFFSFVKELIEQSIKDNIKTLFFLSRDGDIIKKVYDILSPFYKNAPISSYIYASRRSLKNASIFNIEDIHSIFNKKFEKCTIYNIFYNRFGIKVDNHMLNKINLNSNDIIEDSDKIILNNIINLYSKIILNNSKKEREELLSYYKSENFLNENNGIVDIGHEGSLQKALFLITNIKTNGYYFATFHEIIDNVENLGMKSWGYICNREKNKEHYYRKNILMFENLFLNNEGSFIKIDNKKPILLSTKEERARISFSKILQNNILKFNNDLIQLIKTDIINLPKENPYEVCKPFLFFLKNSSNNDINIFNNISFENKYSCRNKLFLLNKSDRKKSIWKAGYDKLIYYKISRYIDIATLNLSKIIK